VVEIDHLVRVGVRQRVQDDPVNDGEDRGVRADGERERQDGGDGERRSSPQPSRREQQILPCVLEPRGDDGVHRVLAIGEWAAESRSRLPVRLIGGQAVRAPFLLDQREMRLDLLPQVVVQATASEHVQDAGDQRHSGYGPQPRA
jgi:hypothetical protein